MSSCNYACWAIHDLWELLVLRNFTFSRELVAMILGIYWALVEMTANSQGDNKDWSCTCGLSAEVRKSFKLCFCLILWHWALLGSLVAASSYYSTRILTTIGHNSSSHRCSHWRFILSFAQEVMPLGSCSLIYGAQRVCLSHHWYGWYQEQLWWNAIKHALLWVSRAGTIVWYDAIIYCLLLGRFVFFSHLITVL